MSYSFTAKAANKAEAKAAVQKAFDEQVAKHQPIHARDRDAVLANASAVIDQLTDDETKDVQVTCSGYLTWTGGGNFEPQSDAAIGGCSVACYAAYVTRQAGN